jgi:hypothetical protein
MDQCDLAELQQQPHLDARIADIRRLNSYQIDGNGICQVCGGIVKPVICNGRSIIGRWCSKECCSIAGKIK